MGQGVGDAPQLKLAESPQTPREAGGPPLGLQGQRACRHLDSGIPASRRCPCLKPSRLWWFVTGGFRKGTECSRCPSL